MSRALLLVTSVVEAAAGAGLLLVPSAAVGLLIGGTLDSPTALAVARLAGAALVTLGAICWFASRDSQSRSAVGIVAALLFYNAVAVGLLMYVTIGAGLTGFGAWPAIVVHSVLAAWCLACTRKTTA